MLLFSAAAAANAHADAEEIKRQSSKRGPRGVAGHMPQRVENDGVFQLPADWKQSMTSKDYWRWLCGIGEADPRHVPEAFRH